MGLTVIEGVGAVTSSVTGIVTGVASLALTIIVSVYVPATRALVSIERTTVPRFVPDAGLRVSHVAPLDAIHFNAPSPSL